MPKLLAFVIEDDPQLSRIFALALQNDFDAQIIINGDDAIARLANEKPRLIVLDLNLPGASGSDVLTYIRTEARLKDTIVILCSADEKQANRLREQTDFVLLKPVSPIQLQQIASRLK